MASTAPLRRVGAIEVPIAVQKQQVRKVEAAVAAPTDNPLYKVVFGDGTPEEKRASIASYLAAAKTKAENKARIAEWRAVEAWLEDEFQRSEKEILHLTDTETFSVLQGIHQDMYGGLAEFDAAMKPLQDLLDAVYALNVADKTFDAYLEIKGDEVEQAKRAVERAEMQQKFDGMQRSINAARSDIDRLGEEKSFFGYGNVKKSARVAILERERAIEDVTKTLTQFSAEITAFDATPARESALGDLAVNKEQLAKLLNISGDDWRAQQQRLVTSALGFIESSKTKLGEVQTHLGRMTEQVDALYDTNSKMGQVYALVGDGVGDALKNTREQRKSTEVEAPVDLTAKIQLADRQTVLDEHAQALEEAVTTCGTGFAATTGQEVQLRTMRQSNAEKLAKARILATQGASSVASQLAMSVNAVSDAALGQSEMALQDTMQKMNDRTNVILQKQVIAQSLTPQQLAQSLDKTVKTLSGLREIVNASHGLMEQGVAAVRDTLDTLHDVAQGLGQDAGEVRAIHSRENAR